MRGDLAAEQGVAVGRGLCGDVRPHGAAGAGTVFDQDLLTEELAPLRPDDSRHDVDATPRREGHDLAQRSVWVLRCSARRSGLSM